jgi:hypothetical protein
MEIKKIFKRLIVKENPPSQEENDKPFLRQEKVLGFYGSLPTKPLSKSSFTPEDNEIILPFRELYDRTFKIKLYRLLRDNIPAINSAIWTWTRLSSAPSSFKLKGTDDPDKLNFAAKIISDLDRRVYQHSFHKFGGIEALLTQFFYSLFTDGAVCGELVLDSSQNRLDKFYFIDPSTIKFKSARTNYELYQEINGEMIRLNRNSTYYYGLDPDPDDPCGRSILSSIPFVTRIEQRLLSDMQKSMHNAGYHRLHVKLKPPDRLPSESNEAYIGRANRYFEDSVEMMKKISVEDNPITWNDVQIDYIGPQGSYAATTSWYINHKALIEEICAGVHLDPFILGYSYGAPYSWAQIKYEMIQRNIISIQTSAKRFMEWIHNLELALQGLDLEYEHHFDNRRTFGLLEQRQAEKIGLENIILKKNAGLIDEEEAKRELKMTADK